MNATSVKGKRVVVMGLGRFGGGTGVTRWLCAQGASVHVTDLATKEELGASLEALAGLSCTCRLGEHDERDLDGCDLLVVNPAVDKAASGFFQAAVRRGVAWSSEMNLFLERCGGRIVGITGSVGKSTTTAMAGRILEAAAASPGWRHGRVWVGGNIGKSLLDDLPLTSDVKGRPAIAPDDLVVLELSSFQLEDAEQVRISPHVAALTNLRENHLDRHKTMAAYAAAKANIFRYQSADDWAVLPMDEDLSLLREIWRHRQCYRWGVDAAARRVRLEGPADVHRGCASSAEVRLRVPGLHNLANAAAAMAIGRIFGVADETAAAALAGFTGLPHRLELVRELAGVSYYNDSKATTPEAAMTSLAAFDAPVVALVGGSEKGSDFSALGRRLAERAKAVICMGNTRQKIADAVLAARGDAARAGAARGGAARGGTAQPPVETVEDFASAMARARAHAAAGDVVLLSPGCPSYDWFRNYEHRGEMFKTIVASWA